MITIIVALVLLGLIAIFQAVEISRLRTELFKELNILKVDKTKKHNPSFCLGLLTPDGDNVGSVITQACPRCGKIPTPDGIISDMGEPQNISIGCCDISTCYQDGWNEAVDQWNFMVSNKIKEINSEEIKQENPPHKLWDKFVRMDGECPPFIISIEHGLFPFNELEVMKILSNKEAVEYIYSLADKKLRNNA